LRHLSRGAFRFTKIQSHAVDDPMQLTCFRTWAAGLGFVLRCRAEVLVEPPVGGAPGLGTLLAKLPTQNIRAAAGERPARARARVIEWYRSTLLSRGDDKTTTPIVVVMQRVHQSDLVGYLQEQGGFDVLNLPAIAPTPWAQSDSLG
jgi:hypothetical protein